MSRGVLSALAAAALLAGGACYQDDTPSAASPGPLARVFLTDAPFPYDSVASVNVHIARIEANEQPDTTGGGEWILVTAPNKSFDLLTLQQGAVALVGEGQLTGHLYRAIRMVIDADRSSIVWNNGSAAQVRWPWPGSGLVTMYALVAEPLFVLSNEDSVEIVIDFDVGRSFLYDYFGTAEFTVLPWLRAVHKAFTGTITGTVTSAYTGDTLPIQNANVTVYAGNPSQPRETWYVVATGRSDAAGNYKIAFVGTGTYIVHVEQPDYPFLDPVITPNVVVTAGGTTTVAVSLTEAGSTGGAYLRISGPTSVGVGGWITLRAAVGNAAGEPVANPSVTWTSSDTAVASVTGVGDTASVAGRRQGYATITAASGGLSNSLTIQVVGSAASVATVTVVPGNVSVAVGDSVGFRADLRDDGGNLLTNRSVAWFTADSAVITLYPYGTSALVRPRAAGTAILRATSEGKTGQATITVH
jgi:hypothetical protein